MLVAGLSAPLTGALALQGRQTLHGAQLWASYAGTLWSDDGPNVRLIWYDDGGSVARTRANVGRLLRDDRVDLLLGPYSSHLSLAAAPLAETDRTVLWNHGGASDDLFHRGFRYVVSVSSPASEYFRDLPPWLAASIRLRRIAVVYTRRGSFGSHVAHGLAQAARAAAQPFLVEHIVLPVGDAVAVATRALERLQPEVVVLATSFASDVALVRARAAWPDSVEIVVAVAAGVTAFHEALGGAAEGVIGCSQWEAEPAGQPQEGPDSAWFVQACRERFGVAPEYPAAASFAAGLVAAACVRRANTTQGDRLREEASRLDARTLFGGFRIDPATGRQVGHRMRLVRWRAGRKAPLL